MESISIHIPASLYTSIYVRHGEQTTNVITSYLSKLVITETAEESEVEAEALQYPRPRAGTVTGRVWEVADRIQQRTGSASREAVIKACMEEGINVNTASTQYSYWKKANT